MTKAILPLLVLLALAAGAAEAQSFFTPVGYRGAFDPAQPMGSQWTAGWTNFSPQSTAYGASRPQVVIGTGLGRPARESFFQNFNRRLDADTVYVLTGLYYVDSTRTLTVEPGTVVLGDSATQGTLIIRRGAFINAAATAGAPIVFAPLDPPGRRNPGDWGGIVLLGRAPVNKTEPVIEGGLIAGSYGGTNALDSTGVMQYVRIEYPGTRFQLNNEVNGLTMGGVGSKTRIDHVQVSYSFDDSFEWFGGTVDARYLVALGGTDDDFDSDFGWSGRVQFAWAKKDPNFFDAAGQTNGWESDNDDPPSLSNPRTSGTFSNVTLVGPQQDTSVAVNSRFERAALLRRNTRMSIHNSILMGYPFGIEIRNDTTAAGALASYLQVRNVSLQARTNVVTSSSVTIPFSAPTWFATAGWGNTGGTPRRPVDLVGTGVANWFDIANPAPIPVSGQGETALFTTNYNNPQLSVREIGEGAVPEGFLLQQNYPNPFNPTTLIRFSIPADARTTLAVYNLVGQRVAELVNGELAGGTYEVDFDASNLPSGTYFYRLSAGAFSRTGKMMLVK